MCPWVPVFSFLFSQVHHSNKIVDIWANIWYNYSRHKKGVCSGSIPFADCVTLRNTYKTFKLIVATNCNEL
jgi:hypothetical protein